MNGRNENSRIWQLVFIVAAVILCLVTLAT